MYQKVKDINKNGRNVSVITEKIKQEEKLEKIKRYKEKMSFVIRQTHQQLLFLEEMKTK